jgi:predicted nucleic acid-binding protein
MRRIFIDSSVIIAGSASSTGASRAVLLLAEIGLFQAVVSEQVLAECQRNLTKKLPSAMPAYSELLLRLNLEVLANPSSQEYDQWQTIIEAKDAPILAAALLAKVDRLLSLNTKDFNQDVATQVKLTIQTPAEFIQTLRAILEKGLS